MKEIFYDEEIDSFHFFCPHDDCRLLITVKKNMINCKIFRHGVYKENLEQINPHTKEEECQRLKQEDLIYGCGKPFYFDGNKLKICEYI